jgi:hypothetical protein
MPEQRPNAGIRRRHAVAKMAGADGDGGGCQARSTVHATVGLAIWIFGRGCMVKHPWGIQGVQSASVFDTTPSNRWHHLSHGNGEEVERWGH